MLSELVYVIRLAQCGPAPHRDSSVVHCLDPGANGAVFLAEIGGDKLLYVAREQFLVNGAGYVGQQSPSSTVSHDRLSYCAADGLSFLCHTTQCAVQP